MKTVAPSLLDLVSYPILKAALLRSLYQKQSKLATLKVHEGSYRLKHSVDEYIHGIDFGTT